MQTTGWQVWFRTRGVDFWEKQLQRVEGGGQMATRWTGSPTRIHTQQEIQLWNGSLGLMPLIWVWWRTQELITSNGDKQPSLTGFLRSQMCCKINVIQRSSSPWGVLKGYLIILRQVLRVLYCMKELLFCVSAPVASIQVFKTLEQCSLNRIKDSDWPFYNQQFRRDLLEIKDENVLHFVHK